MEFGLRFLFFNFHLMVPSYRKKEPPVLALQLNWKNWDEMCSFLVKILSTNNPARQTDDFSDKCGEAAPYLELTVPTMRGRWVVRHGDYIVYDERDVFVVLKPEEFNKLYEPIL